MADKELMENVLLLEKGAVDLYLHGTVESCTPRVRTAFDNALADSLAMQGQTYAKMTEKGWYKTKAAPESEVQSVRVKYPTQAGC